MSTNSEWFAAMVAKGHTPRIDDDTGELDIFVCDSGYHNGPGCKTCCWSCCQHCQGIDKIPDCPAGRSILDGGREP